MMKKNCLCFRYLFTTAYLKSTQFLAISFTKTPKTFFFKFPTTTLFCGEWLAQRTVNHSVTSSTHLFLVAVCVQAVVVSLPVVHVRNLQLLLPLSLHNKNDKLTKWQNAINDDFTKPSIPYLLLRIYSIRSDHQILYGLHAHLAVHSQR